MKEKIIIEIGSTVTKIDKVVDGKIEGAKQAFMEYYIYLQKTL